MGIYEDWQIHTKTGFQPIKLQESQSGLHTNRTPSNNYLYQFHHQFRPFQCQFQPDSRFCFDQCQLQVGNKKLMQVRIKLYKIGTKQNKMIAIFNTLMNSISEASFQAKS